MLGITERLAHDNLTVASFQADLASSYHNLGIFLQEEADPPKPSPPTARPRISTPG